MTEEWIKTGETFTDTAYSDTLKKANSMTNKTPHRHAGMIAEWVKDTSRKVEVKGKGNSYWELTPEPLWCTDYEYRFADTTEQKPKILSSLTDEEIRKLYWAEDSYEVRNGFREIANAAAQRAIEDLEVPPDEWFDDPRLNNLSDEVSLGAAIDLVALYLQDIKEGKL